MKIGQRPVDVFCYSVVSNKHWCRVLELYRLEERAVVRLDVRNNQRGWLELTQRRL
jgi:hypothetical protein